MGIELDRPDTRTIDACTVKIITAIRLNIVKVTEHFVWFNTESLNNGHSLKISFRNLYKHLHLSEYLNKFHRKLKSHEM